MNRINRNKNTIRAIFANQGTQISSGSKTWRSGRQFLIENRKPYADCSPTEFWRGELDLELVQLELLEDHLKTIESQLDRIAKEDRRTQRVMQIH